jgi:hypothetical protein
MNPGFTQVVEKLLDLEITTVWAAKEPFIQSVNKQLFIVENIVKRLVTITY